MAERSGGATLRANIALLENNARVGAEVALVITRMD
jgi:pseudouridine-5'-phosphate glycosidase